MTTPELPAHFTDDRIESLWRKIMWTSADNAPMPFARALVAEVAAAIAADRVEQAGPLPELPEPDLADSGIDARRLPWWQVSHSQHQMQAHQLRVKEWGHRQYELGHQHGVRFANENLGKDIAADAQEPVAWLARYTHRLQGPMQYVTTSKVLADENDENGAALPLYAAPVAPAAAFAVGTRVVVPDPDEDGAEGTVTVITPAKPALYHVHIHKGRGAAYTAEQLTVAPAAAPDAVSSDCNAPSR